MDGGNCGGGCPYLTGAGRRGVPSAGENNRVASGDEWVQLAGELSAEFSGGVSYWLSEAPVGWVFPLTKLMLERLSRNQLAVAEAVALGTGAMSDAARRRVLWRLGGGSRQPVAVRRARVGSGGIEGGDAAALREAGWEVKV